MNDGIDEANPPAGVPRFHKSESALDDPWPPLSGFLRAQIGWWSILYVTLWALGALEFRGPELVGWIVVTTTLTLAISFATHAFPALEIRRSFGQPARRKESWLSLQEGEVVLRDDLVVVGQSGSSHTERLGRLVLTNRRMAFLPAELPGWYRLAAYLLTNRGGRPLTYPLLNEKVIALTAIERFWTWLPAFSGAPAAQVKGELIAFALRAEQGPWQTYASKEDVIAHFKEVEAAWKVAIGLPAAVNSEGS